MKQKLDKSCHLTYNKHIRFYINLKYYVKDVSQMKNAIKKIAATAMAFAILGSGTTAINTISPKSNNPLVASAAHQCGYYRRTVRSNVKFKCYVMGVAKNKPTYLGEKYTCTLKTYCTGCGKLLTTQNNAEFVVWY